MDQIVKTRPDVEDVSPVVDASGFLRNSQGDDFPILLRGFELEKADGIYRLSESLVSGALPGDGEVLIGKNLAQEAGIVDTVTLATPRGSTREAAVSGSVIINGIQTTKMTKADLARLRNETIGFVFRFHYLLPEFTALENVLIPARIKDGKVTKDTLDRARELLKLMGIEKVANNNAGKMSGGQQQRASIARSLINNPRIILADEPTGNLDSEWDTCMQGTGRGAAAALYRPAPLLERTCRGSSASVGEVHAEGMIIQATLAINIQGGTTP